MSSAATSSTASAESKEPKAYYWIPDEAEVWSLAYQSGNELPNGCVKFSYVNTKKFITLVKSKTFPVPDFITDNLIPQDLSSCSSLNPPSMLHCLKQRYNDGHVYTNCGSIVLSINPFKPMDHLYTPEMIARYRDRSDSKAHIPHIYMVPSKALANILNQKTDQTILVSGESGSGKTEAIKQCINFITSVSSKNNGRSNIASSSASSSSTDSDIQIDGSGTVNNFTDRIHSIGPVLDAFGHAKTLRNKNSTRFFKMLDINFNKETLEIIGTNVSCYMIEKSRVTNYTRDSSSRNFHIFYQMLNGFTLEKLQEYHLISNFAEYKYLNSAPAPVITPTAASALSEGDESLSVTSLDKYFSSESFSNTVNAFRNMGFEQQQIDDIFRILAAILHIGNIEPISNDMGETSLISTDDINLNHASKLLQIDSQALSSAICSKTVEQGIKRTLTLVKLSPQKASESRDCIARSLYEKLFHKIVFHINKQNLLYAEKISDVNRTSNSNSPNKSLFSIYLHPNPNEVCKISLLDYFGFEIFTDNSYEQLYINYCNETLHHHFNQVVFVTEKKLYISENINCSMIEFKDNFPIIKEIDSLYKSLDEEVRLPKGSSKGWFDKCKKAPKMNFVTHLVRRDIFVVKHFAGIVEYSPNSFTEKSSDVLSSEIQSILENSENVFVKSLFISEVLTKRTLAADGSSVDNSTEETNVVVSSTSTRSMPVSISKSNIWHYQSQLNGLIDQIRATDNHFIKCFKANEMDKPMNFDVNLMNRQLTYSGLIEVIKMQQTGLPHRLPNAQFMNLYRCLLPTSIRWKNDVIPFINALKQQPQLQSLQSIQCGINLTFYNQSDYYLIDSLMNSTRFSSAVCIQKKFRGYSRCNTFRAIRGWYDSCKVSGNSEAELKYNFGGDTFINSCATYDDVRGLVCFEELKRHCAHMNRIVGFNIMDHFIGQITVKFDLLCSQVSLLKEIEANLKAHTYDSLLTCLSLLDKTSKIELQRHPLIEAASAELSQFQSACDFRLTLENNFSNLSLLLFDDLNRSIAGLKVYEQVIDGTPEILAKVDEYMININNEMSTVYSMLLQALENGRIVIDSITGMIMPLDFELYVSSPMLSYLVSNISYDSLFCQNTKLLYIDCVNFLKLRDEMINSNNPFEMMTFLQNHTPFTATYKHEVEIFKLWTDLELSTNMLHAALNLGRIPDSDNGSEDEVSVAELSKLIDSLQRLVNPSNKVLDAIEAGLNIIKLRNAFLQQDAQLFEKVVNEVKTAAQKDLIFHNFQDCFVELNHCEWQVTYRGLYNDLKFICEGKCFKTTNISAENLSFLLTDAAAIEKQLKIANSFAKNSLCPKLELLSPLVFDILSLRKTVYAQDFQSATAILSTLIENHTATIAKFDLLTHITGEIETCKLLIRRLELENELNVNMIVIDSKKLASADESSTSVLPKSTLSYFTVDPREVVLDLNKIEICISALENTLKSFDTLVLTSILICKNFNCPLEIVKNNRPPICPTMQSPLFAVINSNSDNEDHMYNASVTEKIGVARQLLMVRKAIAALLKSSSNIFNRSTVETEDIVKMIDLVNTVLGFASKFPIREECVALKQFIYANYITSEFIKILQSNCVSTVTTNITAFSMDKDKVSSLEAHFGEVVKTMVQEIRTLPASLVSLRMYVTTVFEFRNEISANNFEIFESYSTKFEKLKCEYTINTEFQNSEFVQIQVENSRRLSIAHLKYTLENLGAQLEIENNQLESQVSGCMQSLEAAVNAAIDNLPPSCKVFDNDTNTVTIVENIPDKSDALINISRVLVNLLKEISKGGGNKIEPDYVKKLLITYKAAELSGDVIERLLKYVHRLQFLKSINNIIFSKTNNAAAKFEAINALEKELGVISSENYIWLESAKVFCGLCKCLELRDNWADIVKSSNMLEDLVENNLNATFSLITLHEETAGDDVTLNAANASKIIGELRQAYRDGFQIALDLKDKFQESVDESFQNASHGSSKLNRSMGGGSAALSLSQMNLEKLQLSRKNKLVEEDEKNLYGYAALRNSGVSIDEIISAKLVPLKYLWAYDIDAVVLKRHKFNPSKLLEVGYTCGELFRAGYSVTSLKNLDFTAVDLFRAGAQIAQMKEARFLDIDIMTCGFQLSVLKAHFTCAQLYRDANFSINELLNAGFNIFDLRLIGISAVQFRNAGINDPIVLRAAGFDLVRLKAAGFTVADLNKSLKCTYKELKLAGFEDSTLLEDCGGAYTEEIERAVLLLFYKSTRGIHWKNNLNWGVSGTTVTDWFGVTTEIDENKCIRVVSIDLHENFVSGSIPPEIFHLKRLKSLRLYINDIHEPVPEKEFNAMMPTLQEVDLSNNLRVKGFTFPRESIPTTSIDLTKFSLGGPNPPKLGVSGRYGSGSGLDMNDLNTSSSGFDARPPSFVSPNKSSDPRANIIYETQSAILSNIFLCLNGKQWKRNDNWCTMAPLRDWYGVVVDKRGFVVSLLLGNNNLKGCLPDCIGDLPTLKILDMRFNKIDGSIPSSLCQLTFLTHLYLQFNKFSGIIPKRIGNLQNIQHIDVRGNHISGKLPTDGLSKLVHLSYFAASSNLIDFSSDEKELFKRNMSWCRLINI